MLRVGGILLEIGGLAAALLLSVVVRSPLPGQAQPPARVYRVGYLNPASATLAPIRLDPLRQGLQQFGYVEGRNLLIEARWGEGNFQRLPELAAELVRLKVDVIVTAATPAALAAKEASSGIPVVMVDPGDPVATKLVSSLARPGGNITGLSSATPDLAAKHLEMLKEALPRLSHVAFLWNAATPAGALAWKEMQAVAPSLGVELRSVGVRSADELQGAIRGLPRDVGGVVVFTDPLTFTHRRRISEAAAASRLAIISGSREFTEVGALMSYGPSFPEMFRRAAVYVDKILKGTKPADLPVEQPTKFEFVVNVKTAKALGVTLPPSLLLRADHMLE